MQNILIDVVNEHKRGYIAVLKSKFPEVFQFIFEANYFQKTLCPKGYSLIDESEPAIVERKIIMGEVFHVPDCGTLTYRRIAG